MVASSRIPFAALALACACASAAPRPSPPSAAAASAPSDLPRSSIAAVLANRAELALDEAQVKQLEELDHEREKRDADVLAQRGPSPRTDRALLGGTTSGRSRRGERAGGAAPGEIQRLLDDDDTRAFLAAEQVLRPEQRERARAFAERYREDRFDDRDQAKLPPANRAP